MEIGDWGLGCGEWGWGRVGNAQARKSEGEVILLKINKIDIIFIKI